MKPPPEVAHDLDLLLTGVLGCQTPLDELHLLRVALRRYAETGNAAQALAEAAGRLSDAFTRTSST